MRESAPVRVLGVGNVLTRDDGIGPYTAAVLEARWEFPDEVAIMDVGTPGLDFTPYLADARLVVVVDAVRSGRVPGEVRIWRDDELLTAPPVARTNPHEPGLREALMAVELEDRRPDSIVLVGVTPGSVETGTRLTPAAREAVERAADAVIQELTRHGIPATAREPAREPQVWWE